MKPDELESEGGVIDRLGQSLDRPTRIRSRRIREKKMIKPSGIRPLAPDERIAPDQRRIGPDKAVAWSRRVNVRDHQHKEKSG
jgi:hypothetical protein